MNKLISMVELTETYLTHWMHQNSLKGRYWKKAEGQEAAAAQVGFKAQTLTHLQ